MVENPVYWIVVDNNNGLMVSDTTHQTMDAALDAAQRASDDGRDFFLVCKVVAHVNTTPKITMLSELR